MDTPLIIPFYKYQAVGNDFVLIEQADIPSGMVLAQIAEAACDRHYGIGGDGLIIVRDDAPGDACMEFYNPDGTRDVCGNGIRCVARHYFRKESFSSMHVRIDSGMVSVASVDGGKLFQVSMHLVAAPRPLTITVDGLTITGDLLNTGTPHYVVNADLLQQRPLASIGPLIEKHAAFAEAVSVDFISVRDPQTAHIQIWERSVGETLACGTAACAVAVSQITRGTLRSPTDIVSKGGSLRVTYEGNTLHLTGEAEFVFAGTYEVQHQDIK